MIIKLLNFLNSLNFICKKKIDDVTLKYENSILKIILVFVPF